MKLALAKQIEAALIRIIKIPEVLVAIGYWTTLQKISVPGSLPSTSVLGLMDSNISLANEIITCINNITKKQYQNTRYI